MNGNDYFGGHQQTGGGLGVYSRAIRRHWWVVLALILVSLVGSAAWLALRTPSYQATTQVLVTPLSPDDETFVGLHVLRDSGDDPTRVLKTAATLIRSPQAALRSARRLGPGWNPKRVLDSIEISPQGQSSILEVHARGDSPGEAARLANVFTRAGLEVRTEALRREVEATLAQLNSRLEETGGSETATPELTTRLNQLEAIRRGRDPTLELTQAASPPTAPSGPRDAVVVLLSLIVGLALGIAAAILLEIFNRRVRDEEDATDLYPIPVLARVPLLPRRLRRSQNGSPWIMPPPVHEAFRTVLVQLTARGGEGGRKVMVTSASTGDGKTTSAVNLAVSIAASGHETILIDFDIRKPDVGRLLGVENGHSLLSLIKAEGGKRRLRELLSPVPGLPNLSVLAPIRMPEGALGLVEALHRRLPSVLAEAETLAEYVVVDSAPLGEVSDALRVADAVDDIIVIARPGLTNRTNFELMRDLLERTHHKPAGMLIIGDTQGASTTYYDLSAGVRRGYRADGKRSVRERLRL